MHLVKSLILAAGLAWTAPALAEPVKLKLDRTQIAGFAGAEAKATLADQVATCNVDDKDQTKGTAFTVKLTASPVVTFHSLTTLTRRGHE